MSSSSTGLPTPECTGVGHWVAEETPEELLAALREFLAPYRDGEPAAHETHERSAYLSQPAPQVPPPEREGNWTRPTENRRSS